MPKINGLEMGAGIAPYCIADVVNVNSYSS